MKIKLKKLIIMITCLSSIIFSSSCSFFNSKNSEVRINTNPQGARIIINGNDHGFTPATLNIPAKKYFINLQKDGYGSAILEVDSWASIKTNVNNKIVADGYRCLLDSLNPFLFFTVFLKNCQDFKKKSYNVVIQQNPSAFSNIQNYGHDQGYGMNNNSLIGVGNNPQNVIYYGYDQNNFQNYPANSPSN
ncbi:MAG: PEGA domain-containing protein [Alphaproteobacteria bacterium]